MTKYGRPDSVVPASRTFAMLRMVHHGQGLPFRLETGDESLVSMPGLMIFSATLRAIGSLLLGHVDNAEPPLADLLADDVRPDPRAGFLQDRRARFLRDGAINRGVGRGGPASESCST